MSICRTIRHFRQISTATAAATEAASTAVGSASASDPAPAAATTITISRAKSKLRSEFDPDKALEIYASASSHYSSPSASRYPQDLTVRRLAKSHRFFDIETLIESHKSDPMIKEETYLSTLIRSYGRAGMFDHALRTYQQMDQLGTPRSVLSFNTLLSAYNACKLFDKVPDLFNEMVDKHDIVPDKLSYGILIKSMCEAGLLDKGIGVLREMQAKGMKVTAVAFTTIVDSLYKRERIEDAEKLWAEMAGTGCELDAAAYNVRIMHAQDVEPEEVRKIIDEMNSAGVKPDTISYNYLMTSYCKLGMMYEAKKVSDNLKENGCRPNAATFRTLVHFFCRNGKYIQGYKVFKESVEVNKIPDFGTLKSLVEGLVKMECVREAKAVIRTVKKKFPPNVLNAWKKVEENLGLGSMVDGPATTTRPKKD